MKKIIMLLVFIGIMISGCIENPLKEVPVVKVKVIIMEKEGNFVIDNFTAEQGTVNSINRPKRTQASSFPSIGTRALLTRGNKSTLGRWEMVPFNSAGTYSFNVGFLEENYPVTNDSIHLSIYLAGINKVTGKGETIGYTTWDFVWK